MTARSLYDSLDKLRLDAIARGETELALVYGWSLIRLNIELIAKRIEELKLS